MLRMLLSVIVLTAPVAAVGCRSEPGGRIDLSRTTHAERQSGQVLPEALIEFSDQVPQRLVADLGDVPEVRDVEGPVTILVGDINNKTEMVSTSDFEMVASRIRSRLINSDIARDKMRFVERRARMNRIAEREAVGTVETPSGPVNYDPNRTFALNGDFYRVGRSGKNDVNQYYMEFQLVSFATNTIVFSDSYDVKQLEAD